MKRKGIYIAAAAASAGAIGQAAGGILPRPLGIALYICATVLMCLAAARLYRDAAVRIRKLLLKKSRTNALVRRIYTDYVCRALLATLPALAVNLAYTVYNGVFGIISRSPWFLTVAAYYAFLSGMRFLAVKTKVSVERKADRDMGLKKENDVLKKDGICLLLMTLVLGGMITLTFYDSTISASPSVMAVMIAAYTFYKIILAAVNMLKVRKAHSPILVCIRNIGFADALVSVFSLQNILILSFDPQEKGIFLKTMNGTIGLAICVIIIAMGIRMVWDAGRLADK